MVKKNIVDGLPIGFFSVNNLLSSIENALN